MILPSGLTLRPEFRPQHDPGVEAAPPSGNPEAVTVSPTGTEVKTADKPGGPAGLADGCGYQQIAMLVMMLVVFYFLLIRPQQKQDKQMKAMRAGVKKGDKVVMSGGMHAVVVSIEDKVILVKPSNDGPTMRFDVTAIGRVVTDETLAMAKDAGSSKKA